MLQIKPNNTHVGNYIGYVTLTDDNKNPKSRLY